MTFSLNEIDENTCEIVERAMGTNITSRATMQASKDAVVSLMRKLLSNADSKFEESENIRVTRRRDELHMTVGITQISIKWPHVFPIVLED